MRFSKSRNASRFYVTRCLEKHGYKHNFPELVKNFNISHDTQLRDSGPCFCLSAVVMRRIMAILEPEKFGIGGTKKSGRKFLTEKFGTKPSSGNPHEAFEKLISKPYEQVINEMALRELVKHCKKWPVILPYCPSPSFGEITKFTRDDYMKKMYNIGTEALYEKPSSLHSMCVVGTLKEHGQIYFICAQTWENCEVVLVPVVTAEEFFEKYGIDRVTLRVADLNKVYTHTYGSPFINAEIPSKEPLSHHQAFCVISRWFEPMTE